MRMNDFRAVMADIREHSDEVHPLVTLRTRCGTQEGICEPLLCGTPPPLEINERIIVFSLVGDHPPMYIDVESIEAVMPSTRRKR